MFSEKDLKELSDAATKGTGAAESIDKQLERQMQTKEINQIKESFQENMKENYMIRKNKEYITMTCSKLCFDAKREDTYKEDNLSRQQKHCLLNCYHKQFRYLIHANLAYTFFTGDQDKIKEFMNQTNEEEDNGLENKEGLSHELIDSKGNSIRIPNRAEMETIA